LVVRWPAVHSWTWVRLMLRGVLGMVAYEGYNGQSAAE
jgi:hypothetical protein